MGDVTKSFKAQSIDGGVVFLGPTGTLALPTSAREALSSEWAERDLGTLADSGLAISYSRSSTKIKNFDGGTYRGLQDEFADGFKATFLDADNINLVKAVYGEAHVTTETATDQHGNLITIHHSSDELPFLQAVIHCKDGQKRKRYTSEICQVTGIAEIEDKYNDVTRYELTVDVYEDEDGRYLVEYRDDGKLAIGS